MTVLTNNGAKPVNNLTRNLQNGAENNTDGRTGKERNLPVSALNFGKKQMLVPASETEQVGALGLVPASLFVPIVEW